MKRIFLFIATIALLVSCSDTTDGIGMSLVTDTNEDVTVEGKVFNVASNSVLAGNIISRSTSGYLGKIKDPETGSYVTCNLMTQLRGAGANQLLDPKAYNINTDSIEADSCDLYVYFSKCYGDSLALMKVVAHELEEPFEENQKYPVADIDGAVKVRANGLHVQNSYTFDNHIYTDEQLSDDSYTPCINFTLNEPYTDKDGNTYKSYGTYLLRKVYANMDKCSNSDWWFIHNVCPGFYIKNIGGIGNLATVYVTQIVLHYHVPYQDSIYTWSASFAGTEEVLQKTAIIQDANKLQTMLNDSSCTYLKSPAGLFTELTLPVDSIMEGHDTDTLNTTRIFLPRINNSAINEYNLPMPSTLLLLPTDSITNFFANNKVADYKTSFLASYNSSYNGYTFNNISHLVTKMFKDKEEKGVTPNWNKVTVIPVETTTSTTSSGTTQITKITYDMSLRSTKLKKGSFGSDNIKASVLYSHFK